MQYTRPISVVHPYSLEDKMLDLETDSSNSKFTSSFKKMMRTDNQLSLKMLFIWTEIN